MWNFKFHLLKLKAFHSYGDHDHYTYIRYYFTKLIKKTHLIPSINSMWPDHAVKVCSLEMARNSSSEFAELTNKHNS